MNFESADFDLPLAHCPLCGTTRISQHDHDFRGCYIDRCDACGVKFMNPQYTDEYLDRYYSTYVDQFQAEHTDAQRQRRLFSKQFDLQWIGEHVPPGRLLSIGCGDGSELLIARQLGWQAEGYDLDEETTRRVAERIDMPIYSGDFFQLQLPAKRYDCVFMDQVLEHPKNPQDYLREIHRILKPGGALFVGCPNIGSLSSMLKTALGKLGLKRRRRGRHYDTFHHLFYYTPRQLARVMEKHFDYNVVGYEGAPLGGVKEKLETPRQLDSWSIRLRRRFPVLEGTFRLLALKPQQQQQAEDAERRRAA